MASARGRRGGGRAASSRSTPAIAALTFSLLVVAWLHAPVGDLLWPVGDALWAIATVIMLLAAVLLLGSLVRNPAAPSASAPGALPERARAASTRSPAIR